MAEKKWWLNMSYDLQIQAIGRSLNQVKRSFVEIGFYLRSIRDNKTYLEDKEKEYGNIWEFAQGKFNISPSVASRWMSINERFSEDGYSPILKEEFKPYNKSQLQEMLYLDDDQMQRVTPEMTKDAIRAIRKPKPKPAGPELLSDDQIPGQDSILYHPELLPDDQIPGQDSILYHPELVLDEKEKTETEKKSKELSYDEKLELIYQNLTDHLKECIRNRDSEAAEKLEVGLVHSKIETEHAHIKFEPIGIDLNGDLERGKMYVSYAIAASYMIKKHGGKKNPKETLAPAQEENQDTEEEKVYHRISKEDAINAFEQKEPDLLREINGIIDANFKGHGIGDIVNKVSKYIEENQHDLTMPNYKRAFKKYSVRIETEFGVCEMFHREFTIAVINLRKIQKSNKEDNWQNREEIEKVAGEVVEEEAEKESKEITDSEPLSYFGLKRTTYPKGSLIATGGCSGKGKGIHNCFNCPYQCQIRDEDRQCWYSNGTSCEKVKALQFSLKLGVKELIGEEHCLFNHPEYAEKTANGDAIICCGYCQDKEFCDTRCEEYGKVEQKKKELEERKKREEEQREKDRPNFLRKVHEKWAKELNEWITAGMQGDALEERKLIVGALASAICDLENAIEPEQPELPKFKNDSEREEWLNNYQSWGLWYKDEHIDVLYYKYDFEDGSRLVVSEYPKRKLEGCSNLVTEKHMHFLEKNRKDCSSKDKRYDRQFCYGTDSMTYMKTWLKDYQKRKM